MANADILIRIRQQGADQLKSMALGFVSLTTAMNVASRGAQAFEDAFKFRATLDANNRAIAIQLKGVRDVGQTFQQAQEYGRRYKLTQEEITAALQTSVGVLRQSKASVEDTIGTLQRLQVLSPEQSIQGAALALKELAGGSTASLVTRFEVSRSKARQMKEEIERGGDAVQVLSKYLSDAGIGMDALKVKTEGAAGRMADLAVANERVQLALSGEGGRDSIGGQIIEARIAFAERLSNVLSRDLLTSIRETARADYVAAQANLAYNEALQQGKTEAEARAEAERRYREEVEKTASVTEIVASAVTAAADAANAAITPNNDLADAHERAAHAAQLHADAEARLKAEQVTGAAAGIDPSVRGPGDGAQRQGAGGQRGIGAIIGPAQEAEQRAEIRDAFSAGAGRFFDLENRGLTTARLRTSELSKQRDLQKSIFDIQKEALDLEKDRIDDRRKTILENQDLRIARNNLANAKDPNLRALAQLKIEEVGVDRRLRANDLASRGGGPAIGGIPAGIGGAPAGVPGAAPSLPGGAGGVMVQVFLDSDEIAARVAVIQVQGYQQSRSGGGGRPRV